MLKIKSIKKYNKLKVIYLALEKYIKNIYQHIKNILTKKDQSKIDSLVIIVIKIPKY